MELRLTAREPRARRPAARPYRSRPRLEPK
jgi:hypothetical protein